MSLSRHLPVAFAVAALSACASTPAPAPAAVPDERDREVTLDGEEPWTGRVARYGEQFALAPGESVAFGAHAPVLHWIGDGRNGVTVELILHRVPFDAVPNVKLVLGSAVPAADCTVTLVRAPTEDSATATLSVTCPPHP